MGYRITGHDLVTGRPAPPYESRQETEAGARAEAERLGIRIQSLEPIETLSAQAQADDARLADWYWPALRWHTSRWALLRLGFEHPRWGRVLVTVITLSAIVVRSKVLPKLIAAFIGTVLAAAGIRADPGLLLLLVVLAAIGLPLLLAKPLIFWRLRRLHAPDGFGCERRFEVRGGELRWFDGQREHLLAAGEVQRVHALSHSVLIGLRHGHEIAIPTAAFDNAAWARRFAVRLAAAVGVPCGEGIRWNQASQPAPGPMQKLLIALVGCILAAVILMLVLLIVFR